MSESAAQKFLRRLRCWLRGGHRYTFGMWARWRTADGRVPRFGEEVVCFQDFACRCGKVKVRRVP